MRREEQQRLFCVLVAAMFVVTNFAPSIDPTAFGMVCIAIFAACLPWPWNKERK